MKPLQLLPPFSFLPQILPTIPSQIKADVKEFQVSLMFSQPLPPQERHQGLSYYPFSKILCFTQSKLQAFNNTLQPMSTEDKNISQQLLKLIIFSQAISEQFARNLSNLEKLVVTPKSIMSSGMNVGPQFLENGRCCNHVQKCLLFHHGKK